VLSTTTRKENRFTDLDVIDVVEAVHQAEQDGRLLGTRN